MRRNRQAVLQFTRNWLVFLRAGVAPVQALELIFKEEPQGQFKQTLSRVLKVLKSGLPLSQAFYIAEDTFEPVYTSMLQVGEATGTLAQTLAEWVKYETDRLEFQKQMVNSLLYPGVVIGVLLGVLIVLIFFFIPSAHSTLASAMPEQELPLIMRGLAGIRAVFTNLYGLGAVFVLLTIGIWTLKTSLKKSSARLFLGKLYCRIPGFEESMLAPFYGMLAILLGQKFPLKQALEASTLAVHNAYLKDKIQLLSGYLASGQRLSEAFQMAVVGNPQTVSILAVSEQSGSLPLAFQQLSLSCAERARNTCKRFVTLFEPAVILILTALVGTVVLSFLLPLMHMVGSF